MPNEVSMLTGADLLRGRRLLSAIRQLDADELLLLGRRLASTDEKPRRDANKRALEIGRSAGLKQSVIARAGRAADQAAIYAARTPPLEWQFLHNFAPEADIIEAIEDRWLAETLGQTRLSPDDRRLLLEAWGDTIIGP